MNSLVVAGIVFFLFLALCSIGMGAPWWLIPGYLIAFIVLGIIIEKILGKRPK